MSCKPTGPVSACSPRSVRAAMGAGRDAARLPSRRRPIRVFNGRPCTVRTWVIDADGSDERQLPSLEDGCAIQPPWSPDGTRLAVLLVTSTDEEPALDFHLGIVVADTSQPAGPVGHGGGSVAAGRGAAAAGAHVRERRTLLTPKVESSGRPRFPYRVAPGWRTQWIVRASTASDRNQGGARSDSIAAKELCGVSEARHQRHVPPDVAPDGDQAVTRGPEHRSRHGDCDLMQIEPIRRSRRATGTASVPPADRA